MTTSWITFLCYAACCRGPSFLLVTFFIFYFLRSFENHISFDWCFAPPLSTYSSILSHRIHFWNYYVRWRCRCGFTFLFNLWVDPALALTPLQLYFDSGWILWYAIWHVCVCNVHVHWPLCICDALTHIPFRSVFNFYCISLPVIRVRFAAINTISWHIEFFLSYFLNLLSNSFSTSVISNTYYLVIITQLSCSKVSILSNQPPTSWWKLESRCSDDDDDDGNSGTWFK